MNKYGLTVGFILAVVLSSIPLFKEYAKVQQNYQIVKRPHHRHHKVPVHGDFQPSELLKKRRKSSHKVKMEEAIKESIKDYEDEEEILVGHTTTIQPIIVKRAKTKSRQLTAEPQCQFQIAETLPATVFSDRDLAENHLPMHEAWSKLFDMAQSKIEIVSYHWGLQRGSGRGQQVFDSLARAVTQRKVRLSIIHTTNKTEDERYDTVDLMKLARDLVSVRSISMETLIKGGGVLHSKLLVADRRHFYLGSANLSDRGLTKTKEMGVLVSNCPTLAEDSAKLFDVYWELGGLKAIPKKWGSKFTTKINLDNPLTVRNTIDKQVLNVYFGSSPPPFCPSGRSEDLSILINAITQAEEFIYVAVADYAPMNVFGKERKPWPILDDLLREAVSQRGVLVKLMLSERAYTYKHRKEHLISLLDLNTDLKRSLVEIKVFHASNISHFKSAHNKYFVTDKLGYIGTSNWAKDYYTRTAGIGFAFESVKDDQGIKPKKDLRTELLDVFMRDWKSEHCKYIH